MYVCVYIYIYIYIYMYICMYHRRRDAEPLAHGPDARWVGVGVHSVEPPGHAEGEVLHERHREEVGVLVLRYV